MNKIKAFILFLICFQLICFANFGVVSATNFTPNVFTVSCLSVATDDSDQQSPAIWDDRVVWEDRRSGYTDIFYYNISSGQEIRITNTEMADLHPDIFADIVVWEDTSNGDSDIVAFNLASKIQTIIVSNPYNQISPKIWGSYVVWEDYRNGDPNIFFYNLITGNEYQMSPDGTPAYRPDIWGDIIVFEEWKDENKDIMIYNVTNGTTVQITNDSVNQEFPSICHDQIVWTEKIDGYTQICLYNITTGERTNLTSEPLEHRYPSIFDNLIVYQKGIGKSDISIIEISSGIEIPLTPDTPDSSQTQPTIWDNRIVWRDGRDWYYDVYLCTLGISKPPLIADFIANTTEGMPPLVVEFTDTSTGEVTGWGWDFGDGAESHEQNPVHVFTVPEIYSVILTVHNPWQRSGVKMEGLITVGSPPTPDFTADLLSGPAPLAVYFADNSIGYPTAWYWDFGDNTTSSEQYPFHTYEVPGEYTVSLTAENKWGNGTTKKENCITVVEGSSHQCILPEEGIALEYTDVGMHIALDLRAFETVGFDPLENQSLMTCVPGSGSGISQIEFISGDEAGFHQLGNETIEGNLSGILLISDDVSSPNRNSTAGLVWDYTYSAFYPEYIPGGIVTSTVWEGGTPEDDLWFEDIAIENYHHVNETAFTLLFQTENIWSSGPATIIFGIDSDWIEAHGWRWSHYIDSEPQGAMVYVDARFIGHTPIEIGEGLAPGNHTVSLIKAGHYGNRTTITIDDKRESIQAIRISDWGEGSFVNTTFLYHDPITDIDYFRIYSPDGLSKFGIVSTWQEGNLFQILQMVASSVVGPSGGGGGGGGSDDGGGPVRTTTTPSQTPVATPVPQITSPPTFETSPSIIVTTLPVKEEPDNNLQGQETSPQIPSGNQGSYLGGILEGTTTLILLRNLSVIFVVIFVTLVFYLRWQRKGE